MDKIDFTTFPSVSNTILDTYSDFASSQSFNIQYSGFLCGTALNYGDYGEACIMTQQNGQRLGGWAFTNFNGDSEVCFCIPVKAGTTLWAQVSGGGKIKDMVVLKATW